MIDESHLPLEQQSLVFRLRRRAEIRLANTERKSVQEGRPDRTAALLNEAADHIDALREALQAFMVRRGDLRPLLYDEFNKAQMALDGIPEDDGETIEELGERIDGMVRK